MKLAPFDESSPITTPMAGVRIESRGTIPVIYDLMRADLEVRRYSVQVFPFDWRKDIGRSADLLADLIRGRFGRKPRPLHVIAHSQGTLVARRAVQNLGADQADRLVNNLVLLGPATFGTFSAAFAICRRATSRSRRSEGSGSRLPADFPTVLQSFTGLYQLLPWNKALFSERIRPNGAGQGDVLEDGGRPDAARLRVRLGQNRSTPSFFNDRTTIILGDVPTVGAVKFVGDRLEADGRWCRATARCRTRSRDCRACGPIAPAAPSIRSCRCSSRSWRPCGRSFGATRRRSIRDVRPAISGGHGGGRRMRRGMTRQS